MLENSETMITDLSGHNLSQFQESTARVAARIGGVEGDEKEKIIDD